MFAIELVNFITQRNNCEMSEMIQVMSLSMLIPLNNDKKQQKEIRIFTTTTMANNYGDTKN